MGFYFLNMDTVKMWHHVVFENININFNESTWKFIPEDKIQNNSTYFC